MCTREGMGDWQIEKQGDLLKGYKRRESSYISRKKTGRSRVISRISAARWRKRWDGFNEFSHKENLDEQWRVLNTFCRKQTFFVSITSYVIMAINI